AIGWVTARGGSGVAKVGASGWEEAFGVFEYLYISRDCLTFARRYWQNYYHTPAYGIVPVSGSGKFHYARVTEIYPEDQARQSHEESRNGSALLQLPKPKGTT